VSLDSSKLSDFGPALYQAKRPELKNDGHALVEHADLISALREAALSSTKDEKVRAIQALRYATRRKEGLVTWKFDTAGVEAKDVINWAFARVQKYFVKK